ncbi:hypothetical protein Q31b_53530 [Novipirellula aureliae]|uniref:Uncharacterized protein n=1 Tax=Novipirellula aureliae TaxID=2527966 RepID=A0A5C6DHD9_9BACT|nr:hypothetical protein Q31b_53530 [Novipirellula aureliae]
MDCVPIGTHCDRPGRESGVHATLSVRHVTKQRQKNIAIPKAPRKYPAKPILLPSLRDFDRNGFRDPGLASGGKAYRGIATKTELPTQTKAFAAGVGVVATFERTLMRCLDRQLTRWFVCLVGFF